MAITLVQTPANVLKAGQRIIYVASSTKVLETGFKFFVQVYDGTTKLFESYVSPNPSDFLIFDLSQIAGTLVKPDTSPVVGGVPIHSNITSVNDAFKKAPNINRFVQVRIGEVYEVTGTLTEFADLQNQDVHIIDGWDSPSDGYGKLLATDDFGLGKKIWATDRVTSTKKLPEHISVTNTYGVIAIGAAEGDWGTIGFYNNNNTSPGINTLATQIIYTMYEADGTSIGTSTIGLTATTNSGLPTSTDGRDKLIYMDVYPGNLSGGANLIRATGVHPKAQADWSYYTFTPTTASAVVVGATVCVFKEDDPCKHKRYVLGWQNSFGTYDYLPFTGRAEHEIKRKSKRFNTFLGNYDGTTFDFSVSDRQEAEYSATANKYIKVSNYFTEGEYLILQKAMVSKEVVLIESGSEDSTDSNPKVIPVLLDTNSMKVHEELESKIKSIELTLKVAQTYAFS